MAILKRGGAPASAPRLSIGGGGGSRGVSNVARRGTPRRGTARRGGALHGGSRHGGAVHVNHPRRSTTDGAQRIAFGWNES